MNIKNEKGILLILTFLIVIVISILSAAFLLVGVSESKIAERQRRFSLAFNIAEAGLERALFDLRQDFLNPGSSSFGDGDINGMLIGPDTNNYYTLYSGTLYNNGYDNTMNGGSYTVELLNDAIDNKAIWIRSTGTFGDVSETIRVYMRMLNISIWDNAIFAGVGQSGAVINGNVDIRGGVHILGSGVADTDIVFSMSGTGGVGNNYDGLAQYILDKIPALDTTLVNGEMVETLKANLRIRQGQLALSGTGTAGDPDVFGNAFKETLDGVFLNDGYNAAGNQNESNVYSDNGPFTPYDFEIDLDFPGLNDTYNGVPYRTWFQNNALVINSTSDLDANGVLDFDQIVNITPESVFSFSDANGTFTMDGAGNMTIDGMVYVDGGELNMNKAGENKTINYTGSASFLVDNADVTIDLDLITAGDDSYPSNAIGVMTNQEITFNASSIDIMGLFYAENKITVMKQTNIMGGIVSNLFDMGNQVPSIFQVPSIIDFLPFGMIDNDIKWATRIISWERCGNAC